MNDIPNDITPLYQLLYEEGWRQYVHEDNLAHRRATFYMGILVALLVVLSAIAAPVARVGEYTTIEGHTIHFGIILLGVIFIIYSFFSLIVCFSWKSVTEAGNKYLNLRWATVRVIEHLAVFESIGLATMEDEYRKWSRDNTSGYYVPFSGKDDFPLTRLKSYHHGGFRSMIRVIRCLRYLYFCLLTFGVFLLWAGYFAF